MISVDELLTLDQRYRADAERLNIPYREFLEAKVRRARGRDSSPPADEAPTPEIDPEDVATIADLRRAGSEVRWAWDGWLPSGVLTALAAPAGTGKTRFCCDLLRRVRHGLPWPDGKPMTLPPDSLSLWVVADNHHDQLVDVAGRFGLEDVVRINATRAEPYGGVSLETVDDYLALEGRIKAVRPSFVFIDTVGNATDKNLSRQEDAKSFYQPLQILARRYACALVCVTHLNASGQFLGRRVMEKVRVALKLEQFKGEEKLRLDAPKSFTKKPAALGVTMGDGGNEYDDQPPEPPEDSSPFRPVPETQEDRDAADWLRIKLQTSPQRVSILRDLAQTDHMSSKTLYRAMKTVRAHEFERNGYKWWELPSRNGH
jgi:hypothetical protein